MKNNVLKRKSKSFIFETLRDVGDWKKGTTVAVRKDDFGYHAIVNDKAYLVFPSMLRNGDLMRLVLQWDYYSF